MAQEGFIDYSEGGHGYEHDPSDLSEHERYLAQKEEEYPMAFATLYFLLLFIGVMLLVMFL